MDRIVLFLCGLWFWITRKYRTTRCQEIANFLDSARHYLSSDFHERASTRDRGGLLPDQMEALTILERQHMHIVRTGTRFGSLAECVRMVAEELSEPRKAA